MKQVGIIMSYDSYEEYREHKEKMIADGYRCMDCIPAMIDVTYYRYIRYLKEEKTDK